MKVAIIGSRNFNDYLFLSENIPFNTSEIISGGAIGVDKLAYKYAKEHNLRILEILPDYKKFGKYAPLKRNLEIISQADYVLAFWDGSSKGTRHVIDSCLKENIPVKLITF